MIEEELEKEAEEYALNQWEGNLPWSVIQKSYYDGALPREKQIEIDAEQIRALQKLNGELTDKVRELEEELIEADNTTDVFNAQEKRIAKLEAQIEKMKSVLIDIRSNTDDVNIEWQIKYLFDELEVKENAMY